MAQGDRLYRLMLAVTGGVEPVIRRALEQGVVLDTWLTGEREEAFSPEAEVILDQAVQAHATRAGAQKAIFPHYAMPPAYVEAVFSDLLTGTALYEAQRSDGTRTVQAVHARRAAARLDAFLDAEPGGLTAVARYHATVGGHEDLNALTYYGRMARQDFLLGTLHRPWSDRLLTPELGVYLEAGLVRPITTGAGEELELTPRGQAMLDRLRAILTGAGEFAWQADAQRWVIFGETDYDQVFATVFPDMERDTEAFLDAVPLPGGHGCWRWGPAPAGSPSTWDWPPGWGRWGGP